MYTRSKNTKISRKKLANLLDQTRKAKQQRLRQFINAHPQLDISYHAWRAWEAKESLPSMENLVKLATFFKVSVEEFLESIAEGEDEDEIEDTREIRPYLTTSNTPTISFDPYQSLLPEQRAKIGLELIASGSPEQKVKIGLELIASGITEGITDKTQFIVQCLIHLKFSIREKHKLGLLLLNEIADEELI